MFMEQAIETKAEIVALLQACKDELKQLGVKQCGIFGAFVEDTLRDRRDIGVLVSFERDRKTFDDFMHLSFFLEDRLGRAVDLVTVEADKPHIGRRMLREVEYIPFDN